MQEFFKINLETKFIKYLLSYTPLPIIPTISSDDRMVAGCDYIYKHDILHCTKTGRFNGINANQYIDDHLYVNEYVYTTDDDYVLRHYNPETETYDLYLPDEGKGNGEPGIGGLTVTDDVVRYYYRPVAEYKVLDNFSFGQYIPNITQRFISNVSYYDPLTHRFLGEYLRCLRDIYGLNLMSLYNCFDYEFSESITISRSGITETTPLKSKVLIVPIKFNKTYTIAIDCSFPVYAKAVFYDNQLLKDENGNNYSDLLPDNVTIYNGMTFNNPVTYKISNDLDIEDVNEKIIRDKQLQDLEKYLCLAIQIPRTITSSIVIIEGDYAGTAPLYIASAEGINTLSDNQLSNLFKSELSLLQTNTQTQIPYADKLIAYLLQYTIDCREEIDDNVANIETKIGYNPPLPNFYKGIWDNDLRYVLYNRYMNLENPSYIQKTDILGFVDRDIDNAVRQGLIHYEV